MIQNISLLQTSPTGLSLSATSTTQIGTLSNYNQANSFNTPGTNIFNNTNGTWQINTTGYYRIYAQVSLTPQPGAPLPPAFPVSAQTTDVCLSIYSANLGRISSATYPYTILATISFGSATIPSSVITMVTQTQAHLLTAGDLISVACSNVAILNITAASSQYPYGTSFSVQLYGF